MTVAIRYSANLAEEDPNGNLVGVEAVAELEDRIEELYEEGIELFDACEALAAAVEEADDAGLLGEDADKVRKRLVAFRQVTGG